MQANRLKETRRAITGACIRFTSIITTIIKIVIMITTSIIYNISTMTSRSILMSISFLPV